MHTSTNNPAKSVVMNRIDELRSVFQFGEKMLPLLDEFFQFMKEMIPLLDGINNSIEESSSKLPKASTELNNVTKATENAAIEILDNLDLVTKQVDESCAVLQKMQEEHAERSEKVAQVFGALDELPSSVDPATVARLKELVAACVSSVAESTQFGELRKTLQSISEKAGVITITLQVQDITSQQLAAVNHLVRSVHERLSLLLQSFDKSEIKIVRDEVRLADLPQSFDPNASWSSSDSKQDVADELLEEHGINGKTNGTSDGESKPTGSSRVGSQQEVDELFIRVNR